MGVWMLESYVDGFSWGRVSVSTLPGMWAGKEGTVGWRSRHPQKPCAEAVVQRAPPTPAPESAEVDLAPSSGHRRPAQLSYETCLGLKASGGVLQGGNIVTFKSQTRMRLCSTLCRSHDTVTRWNPNSRSMKESTVANIREQLLFSVLQETSSPGLPEAAVPTPFLSPFASTAADNCLVPVHQVRVLHQVPQSLPAG